MICLTKKTQKHKTFKYLVHQMSTTNPESTNPDFSHTNEFFIDIYTTKKVNLFLWEKKLGFAYSELDVDI